MIQRRVTVFCKLAIFWDLMRLSKHFSVRAPMCCSDGNTIRVAEKDDLEASASIFQIGHVLSQNGVK